MGSIRKVLRVSMVAVVTGASADGALAYRHEDKPYAFNLPSQIQPVVPDYSRRTDLNQRSLFQSRFINFLPQIKPDLDINAFTMRLPEIQVRDLGDAVWTYQKESSHFDSDLKRYDSYRANIRLNVPGAEPSPVISLGLGKMKYATGSQTPKGYTRTYRDEKGNTLEIKRFGQTAHPNPSMESFRSYIAANGPNAAAGVPEPSHELIDGYQEKWTSKTLDSAGAEIKSHVLISIDQIKHDSNFKRFVTGYAGTVRNEEATLSFDVKSPHDRNGNIQSMEITISAKGAPSATVTWKPTTGTGDGTAFALLRENLPVPVLIGPRGSFRLNGVDIPESPLQVTAEGTVSPQQLGSRKEMANLMGLNDLGIHVTFSAPRAGGSKPSFSLGNALKNLWYMVTGHWSEVNSMRQELNAMQKQEPAKFFLAAGFSDPSFMEIKELRKISGANKSASIDIDFHGKGFFDVAKAIVKIPFQIVGGTLRAVFNLPVIKQTWTAVRITTGVAIGIVTGDTFNRSSHIQFDANGPAVITINGIKNNDKAAQRIAKAVQEGFQVAIGTKIKNDSHWFGLGDLIQIIAHEYLGAIDKPSLDTAKAIRTGIREKGEVYVVAHSQGSAIFKQALTLLSKEERFAVHYLGAGPEWNIDAKTEGLASAENLWNRGDFVPYLGNRYKVITNFVLPWNWGRDSYSNVQKDLDVGAKWGLAHQFVNYEEAVKKWAEKWRQQWNYGALQHAY